MKLINIGFGNMVNAERVVAVVSPESAPIKRIIREAEDKGNLINATYGRRTRAVIVTDSDHIVLSALQTETVSGRLSGDTGEESVKGDEFHVNVSFAKISQVIFKCNASVNGRFTLTQQINIRAINNLYLHRTILFFYTFVSKEQYFKVQR